jgi:hypothetical protein
VLPVITLHEDYGVGEIQALRSTVFKNLRTIRVGVDFSEFSAASISGAQKSTLSLITRVFQSHQISPQRRPWTARIISDHLCLKKPSEQTRQHDIRVRRYVKHRLAHRHARFALEFALCHDLKGIVHEAEPYEEKKVRNVMQPCHESTCSNGTEQHRWQLRPTVSSGGIDHRGHGEVEDR